MPFRSLEQGIKLIQQGNHEEGAHLVRISLRSELIQGAMRVSAFLWLAETVSSRDEKLVLYHQALNVDPENEYARQRITQLYASGLPPTPTVNPRTVIGTDIYPTAQIPPQQNSPPPAGFPSINQQQGLPQRTPEAQPIQVQPGDFEVPPVQCTVGILNGPNGQGTGFFVTHDGLVVTTRYIVGGMETLIIELEPGHRVKGKVVRAYPEIDLALIYTGVSVGQLPSMQTAETLVANARITAIAYPGSLLFGQRRSTRTQISRDWFPTTIGQMADSGGNPVFDERNMLVGMLTRNANRTSPYVYGLNMKTIYQLLEHYLREVHSIGEHQSYCPGCGNLSRAGGAGGYYCETCGHIFPQFLNTIRYQMSQFRPHYSNLHHRPCTNCGAREGYYESCCLRCGQQNRL